ncbi:MAG TPA: PQQ-dependent sugar dehydrogenase [Tepidisphaeraceae bacterium]|jgi:glucose/arabinose dehydrogenase|nr:PQQ-dependent sugar dehydrogenase [Tepidisphaeraceae bacterium]
MHLHRKHRFLPALFALTLATSFASAQNAVPASMADTAHPGGHLPKDVSIQLVEVAGGFVDPIHVTSANDGTGRLFVCERPGTIRIIDKDGKVLDEPFYDNKANTSFQFLENGLYCVAFHPKFKENGLLYIAYADLWFNGATFIVEYHVDKDEPNKVDMSTARPIMRIDFPYCNHHGGKIAFGPDGYLYIGVGDGGWEGDVLETGQDLSTYMGKMLRIDVDVKDRKAQRYTIPDSNPYAHAADPQLMVLFGKSELEFSHIKQKAKPEIWAYGIRNPWTFSFDRKTGDLYIADVGQNTWEEIDFQPASSKGGENYGWSIMDGTHPFPIEKEQAGEKTPPFGVPPIAEYSHATDGICIAGFGVSHSPDLPALDGVYLAGDWGSGRIWGVAQDSNHKWQMQELLNTSLNITSGNDDEAGNLYVTSATSQYGTWNPFSNPRGSVWKIVASDKVPAGAKTAPLDKK